MVQLYLHRPIEVELGTRELFVREVSTTRKIHVINAASTGFIFAKDHTRKFNNFIHTKLRFVGDVVE